MRGLTLSASTPASSGLAAILRLMASRRELALRDRADDAEVVARRRQEHRHRAGHDDRVQDRLVAVAVDHHHVARRHRVVPHHLVGLVLVPLVTKKQWSALKMRAALRSLAATGPVWSSSWPSSSTALQTSARSMFSPKNWWNIWPTGLFRKATPPEWPGQCHEYEPSCA